MDLSPLQIDRSQGRAPARRSRSSWFGRVLFLVIAGGLLLLFRRPLLGFLDRLRLPEVRVLEVSQSRPSAAAAVQGTAANGYIVARTRAALSADTPGRIVEMNVTEGQAVPKGFVVARLYSDEVEALVARAEADLALARAGVVSAGARVEVARAAIAEAQSRVTAAEADVADATAGLRWAGLERERARTLEAEGIGSRERTQAAEVAEEQAGARLASARAAHANARQAQATSELERASAEARVREAEALVAVKSAEREQARATLDKLEVRAPFDGVVVLKDAEVGEVVSPNAVGAQSRGSVATMVDPRTYEVQVELPETNLAAATVGAPAAIYIDAFPERPYPGHVLRIWPTANRQKATVEVRVGFDVPDGRLRAEMGARIVFLPLDAEVSGEAQSTAAVILIPQSAVVPIEGKASVFVLERDVARVRALELGEERTGRVIVRAGLAAGERIVDEPPPSLEDGDRVREGS